VFQKDVPEDAVQKDVPEDAVQKDVPEDAVQKDVPEKYKKAVHSLRRRAVSLNVEI